MQKNKKKDLKNFNLNRNLRVLATGLFSLKGIYLDRPDKANQDCAVVRDLQPGCLAAVADGHGYYGEYVSQFLIDQLSRVSQTELENPGNLFLMMNERLKKIGTDLTYSGSTLSLAYFSDKLLICSVGDSPVILGANIGKGNKFVFNARIISKIHKLEDREEAQRVSRAGARITWGPPSRLWLRDKEAPGLCVTRAFGDLLASTIGVIVEPHIESVALEANDKFLVIASDGVTDWLTTSDICAIIRPLWNQGEAQVAANRIVAKAREKCTESNVDDMTCIVIFFEIQ